MIATGNPRVILTVSSRYCRPSLQAILMIALLLALLAGSGARAGDFGPCETRTTARYQISACCVCNLNNSA